jgi:malonyl-CoA/methylmalonyl-CoA synthetase
MTARSSCNVIAALYGQRSPDSRLFQSLDGTVISTAEALSRVRGIAASLCRLGVEPGDRISFRLLKSVDTILLAHAGLWVGAVLHPLNDTYTSHELTEMLANASPKLLLTDPRELEALRPLAAAVQARIQSFGHGGSVADFGDEFDLAAEALLPPDGAAVLLHTSGTTGKPKGALITHENLLSSARSLAQIWGIRRQDVLLHGLPIYHAHGLLTSIDSVLAGDGSILLLPSFELASVRAALARATVIMGVPTHYSRLVADPELASAVHGNLRLAISGSAPLPTGIAEQFERLTGVPIIERYGSTEAAIITAVPPNTKNRSGWVGWPLPGVQVRVATPDGPRSSGVGSVQTRGPNVFSGYWRDPAATAEAFTADGWFITGDVGEIDDSGCLRLLGRDKDIIISGGLNVYPAEVEDALRRIPGLKDVAVFGVPHPDFGEAVVAAVEQSGALFFDQAAAVHELRSRLAPYKLPKQIVVVEEIPRNSLGKIVKARLKERFRALFEAPAN